MIGVVGNVPVVPTMDRRRPESESPVVQDIKKAFNAMKLRRASRRLSTPHIGVSDNRVECERACSELVYSMIGCVHIYIALLTAISDNAKCRFTWILDKTVDVISRDEDMSGRRQSFPIQSDMDEA